MTARKSRSTKVAELDVNLNDLESTIETDDVVDNDPDVEDAPKTSRKYMSHAGHDHARKGEAGKLARAKCRRDVRAWLNAEAEFLAETDDNIAV